MKKLLLLCACALLVLSLAVPALAEGEAWQIYTVASGSVDDFDGDEVQEGVDFSTELDEYGDGGFTLTVGDQTAGEEYCVYLDPTLRAMKLGSGTYAYGTIFMVSEHGPSDDPYTYCYLYMDGVLRFLGGIPAHADTFAVNDWGMITTEIRSDMLGTWLRPADYVFCMGYDWESEEPESYACLAESPRDLYPMRVILQLDADLPVRASRFDQETSSVLHGGQRLALTATDDRSWVFASSLDGEEKGWIHVRTTEYLHEIELDGRWALENEVFSSVPYAD